MKKTILFYMVFAISFSSAAFFYYRQRTFDFYPNSELILKKYYPANEILGMAFDKSWREVRISNDSLEEINHWYEKIMHGYILSENRSDTFCSKKSWQQEENIKLRLIICDHGDYRTILTVRPE